jgi:putative FmdB family regulatory protein
VPIYEYHCKKCGADYEEVRSFAEMDKRRACPKCSSRATQRKVSMSFAVVGSSDTGFDDFDFGDEMDHAHGMDDDMDMGLDDF